MAKLNPTLGDLRGSIAGNTFSRNTFGAYVRQKVTPVNPATNRQEAVRAALATASSRWSGDLTAAQRTAWKNYAAGTPSTDVFGNQIFPTGLQRYVGTNILRNLAGEAFLNPAPATVGSSDFLAIFGSDQNAEFVIADSASVDLANSFGTEGLNAATDQTWDDSSTGDIIQAQISPLLPVGVDFYVGPYTLTEYVVSDAAVNRLEIALGTIVVVGDRFSVRLRRMDIQGRISPDIFQIVTAANNA